MSEKEQAQALKLLNELFQYAKAGTLPPADLVAKAARFLEPDETGRAESHGSRRS